MKKLLAAALLASAASVGTIAVAQVKPTDPPHPPPTLQAQAPNALLGPETVATYEPTYEPVRAPVTDARSLASDQEVGEARRYYRAQCEQFESAAFCDCVTAGVAQALMPEEVRIAGRTIGERITAQGDAYMSESSDLTPAGASSAMRIQQIEAHYADACHQYRR